MQTLRNLFMVTAAVGLVSLGAACTKDGGGSKAEQADDSIVARVNDSVITTADLQEELDKLPPYLKSRVATPEGRREFLDNLLTRRALMEEAERLGLADDPQIAKQIREYRERLILQRLMQDNIPKEPEVSEDEIRTYFDSNPQEFKESEQVRVRHILIKAEQNDPAEKRQAAQQRARELLNRARGGEDFQQLAREHSEDVGSATRGGDLGFFPRGRMAKPFEDTAFNMKDEGELSGVVETQFGYHVIQFVDRQEARERSYEDARDQIRRRLAPQRQRDSYQGFIETVKGRHEIVINEAALQNMGASIDDKPAAAPQAHDHHDHEDHDHAY
jgi:peptidyl-prolyl cis-trans isomerase C